MLLNDVFAKQSINIHLESKTKDEAFKELIENIASIRGEFSFNTMLEAVLERENKMSTSIAPGVAIPHGYYPGTDSIFGAIGVSESGIDYGAPNQKPVYCIFLIIMGESAREKHLRVLTSIMSFINSGGLNIMRKAQSPEEIYKIMSHIN